VKIAIFLTFLGALMAFFTMAVLQSRLGLEDFRFGSNWTYGEKALRQALNKNHRSKPLLVIVPLLFPLDLFFLIFFGLLLSLLSVAHADALGVSASNIALVLVLPVTYMVADFSENMLYSGMLAWPDTIGHLIIAATWATRIKLVAVGFAILQGLGSLILSWQS
jgi:hypothetical protein